MAFSDLADHFDPGLKLPIRGKVYEIPAPNAHDGLRLRMLFQQQGIGLSDQGELAEIMRLLGATWEPRMVMVDVVDPATGAITTDEDGNPQQTEIDQGQYVGGIYQQMADDGVSWTEIMHAGRTALLDAGLGRTMAETHWLTGLADAPGNQYPPKPGGNRAARRATKKAAPKAGTKKAATGRSTAARKRTAKTTPAAPTTTPKPASETDTAASPKNPN